MGISPEHFEVDPDAIRASFGIVDEPEVEVTYPSCSVAGS